jgi:hypothetical protein
VHLRIVQSTADRVRHLARHLLAQTNVALAIANNDNSAETCALTGLRLLLHRRDLLRYSNEKQRDKYE